MTDKYHAYGSLLGRFLLALMFVISGFSKLTGIANTATFIAGAGLPAPQLLAVLAGALEVLGGLALILGYKVRYAGLILAIFTILASVIFHAYWAAPPDKQFVTQLLFMKNLSVAGGLVLISALGAGPMSLDVRRLAHV